MAQIKSGKFSKNLEVFDVKEAIEEIIAFHFTPEEPMTLGKLVELDAFQHIEAIQEVSGRASSEASLEAILKKVRLEIQLFFYVSFGILSLTFISWFGSEQQRKLHKIRDTYFVWKVTNMVAWYI